MSASSYSNRANRLKLTPEPEEDSDSIRWNVYRKRRHSFDARTEQF
jgi:hypothetical protein